LNPRSRPLLCRSPPHCSVATSVLGCGDLASEPCNILGANDFIRALTPNWPRSSGAFFFLRWISSEYRHRRTGWHSVNRHPRAIIIERRTDHKSVDIGGGWMRPRDRTGAASIRLDRWNGSIDICFLDVGSVTDKTFLAGARLMCEPRRLNESTG
jgi:hypothetical protein